MGASIKTYGCRHRRDLVITCACLHRQLQGAGVLRWHLGLACSVACSGSRTTVAHFGMGSVAYLLKNPCDACTPVCRHMLSKCSSSSLMARCEDSSCLEYPRPPRTGCRAAPQQWKAYDMARKVRKRHSLKAAVAHVCALDCTVGNQETVSALFCWHRMKLRACCSTACSLGPLLGGL